MTMDFPHRNIHAHFLLYFSVVYLVLVTVLTVNKFICGNLEERLK